jgi:NTE family protein
MNDIKYLVFSGGGAAGYAHGGAVEQLSKEPNFSFSNIKAVAGSSIGAIAALMVSLNYTPQEINKKLSSINLKNLKDGGCLPTRICRLFKQYGVYQGDALYQLIKDIIREKVGKKNPESFTFEDLKLSGGKDLYVVATKIYKENNKPTGKEKVFSFEKTPKTSVAAAVLASASAPGYFRRVRLKKIEKGAYILNEQGDVFDDGGIINNLPLNIFDQAKFFRTPSNDGCINLEVNPHTLGLALLNSDQIEDGTHNIIKTPIRDNHPFEYCVGIFNALLLKFEKNGLKKNENRQRTIQIDRLGVTLGDFNIDEKTKKALIESGKKAVRTYFQTISDEEKNSIIPFTSKQDTVDRIWLKTSVHQDVPEKKETIKNLRQCLLF